MKDDFPDAKRRRVDESRIKSPTASGSSLGEKEDISKNSLRSEKQPGYAGLSERHHMSAGKDPQQQRYQQQGAAHAGGGPGRQGTTQSKTSPSSGSSIGGGGTGSAPSKSLPSQQSQSPHADNNLFDLLR